MSITNPTHNTLPTILYRQDSLVDTELVYLFLGRLYALTINNEDLTYLEYGEMCESYSDYTGKSTYYWEVWSTTDRMTNSQLSELIANEVCLQNKATPESIEIFKTYASDNAICQLLKIQNRLKGKRKKPSASLLQANRYWRVQTDTKAIKAIFNLRYA